MLNTLLQLQMCKVNVKNIVVLLCYKDFSLMTLHHDATLIISILIPNGSHGLHLAIYRTRNSRRKGLSFSLVKETKPSPKNFQWIYVNWRQLLIF